MNYFLIEILPSDKLAARSMLKQERGDKIVVLETEKSSLIGKKVKIGNCDKRKIAQEIKY